MDIVQDLKGSIKNKLKKWLVIGLRIIVLNENVQLFAATRIKIGHFDYIFTTTVKVIMNITSIGIKAELVHQHQ